MKHVIEVGELVIEETDMVPESGEFHIADIDDSIQEFIQERDCENDW